MSQKKEEKQPLPSGIDHKGDLGESNPVSKEEIEYARNLWIESAMALLDEEMRLLRKNSRIEAFHALEKMKAKLGQERGGMMHGNGNNLLQYLKKQPKQLSKELSELFNQLGLPANGLKKRLCENRLARLNQGQEWKAINKEILLSRNGTHHRFYSTIRPAAQLGNIFTDIYCGTGVASASTTERRHAVNLCATELRDEGGLILFKGLRHGVHSAYGIESDADRGRANRNRALETLRAALVTHPELLGEALNGELVELKMASVSLLTPDNVRPFYSRISNERKQLREQLAAWAVLNDLSKRSGGIELEVQNGQGERQQVRVKVHVLPFNFGVNEAAVVGKFGLSSRWNLVSGWRNVYELNARAMRELLGDTTPGTPLGGRVGEFFMDHPHTPHIRVIRKLSEQIRDLWTRKTYVSMGRDPYKMVSRLAMLAYLTDQILLWNCKSGKDRAGMMDVEAKFLAARMALTGDVPEPDAELSEEEKSMFREFALNSGNLEIQRLNTGIAGFKTEGVPAIDERLGSSEARAIHRGASWCVED